MKRLFGVAFAVAAACGVQTAEPIAITPPTEVILVEDGLTDPYACATIEDPDEFNEIDGHTVVAFATGFGGGDGVGGEGADYAGVCKQTHESCWYTGISGTAPRHAGLRRLFLRPGDRHVERRHAHDLQVRLRHRRRLPRARHRHRPRRVLAAHEQLRARVRRR